jgi:hypothetical protein
MSKFWMVELVKREEVFVYAEDERAARGIAEQECDHRDLDWVDDAEAEGIYQVKNLERLKREIPYGGPEDMTVEQILAANAKDAEELEEVAARRRIHSQTANLFPEEKEST